MTTRGFWKPMKIMMLVALRIAVVLMVGGKLALSQAVPQAMSNQALPNTTARIDGSGDTAPKLKLPPADAIREFEGPEEEVYTLGAGDEITLVALGHDELSGHHVIGPDGRVTLPLVGPFTLAGQTREHAAESIATALTPFYQNLSIIVRVDKYGSNRVLIMGRVSKPGVLYFDRIPTLLEAISQSGGLLGQAGAGSGPGSGEMIPSRCAIYRGKDAVLWVNLRDLLDGGVAADVRLRRNDVIYIPAEQDEYVSVMGQVKNPGAFRLTSSVTVREVIAMAGGLTEDASQGHIHLIRPDTGINREISFKDLISSNKALDFTLRKGDVIYVPQSGMSKIGYVMQKLSPATSLLMMGTTLAR